MADLYVSLSRTAGILDVPVAEISRLRANHAFPRNYNFDTVAKDGRPPGQKETAAPGGAKRDGISVDLQEKHTLSDANKQGTPCQKCHWLYGGQVRARGCWWK